MKLGLGNMWVKLGAAVTTCLVTNSAFAQSLTTLQQTANEQTTAFSQIISYGGYGIGTLLGVRGVMLCKAHGDNPGNTGLNKGIAHLAGAAGCIAAPFVIQNVLGTIGASTTGNGAAAAVQQFRQNTF